MLADIVGSQFFHAIVLDVVVVCQLFEFRRGSAEVDDVH